MAHVNKKQQQRFDDEESLYTDARILAGVDEENEARDPCFECVLDYSKMQLFANLELFRMAEKPEDPSNWLKDPGQEYGNKYFALEKGYFSEVLQEPLVEASYVGDDLTLLVVTNDAFKENFEHDSGILTMDDYKTMIEKFGQHDGFMVKQLFDNIVAGRGSDWQQAAWEVCIYFPSLHKIHSKQKSLQDIAVGGGGKRRRINVAQQFPILRL